MISTREKIHTPNPFYLISSSLQKLQISCQAGRLAGNINHSFHTKINDLYSGTGTIAQILAPVAKKVVGVEIVEEAVEAAKENAALNGLDNCTFWAGDVLKVIDDLGEVPDLIVLDPPRDGVHPKALEKIIDFAASTASSTISTPTTFFATGARICAIVPVPL